MAKMFVKKATTVIGLNYCLHFAGELPILSKSGVCLSDKREAIFRNEVCQRW